MYYVDYAFLVVFFICVSTAVQMMWAVHLHARLTDPLVMQMQVTTNRLTSALIGKTSLSSSTHRPIIRHYN